MTTRTLTWRAGEPCPMCGQIEPHSVVSRHGTLACTPGESRRGQANIAGDLLFGLKEAEALGFDENRIRNRIAELERMVQLGDEIPHQGPS